MYIIIPTYEGRASADTVVYDGRSKKLKLISYEYNYKRCVPTVFRYKKKAQQCINDLWDEDFGYHPDFCELDLKIVKVKVV